MRKAAYLYAALAGLYVASRLLLFALGIRFLVSYSWQHFHDLDVLTDRLWESLLYTHSFAPFMNLLVGVVLKLVGHAHAPAVYHGVFLVTGLGFVLAMAYVMDSLRFDRRLTLAVTTVFFCSPAFIYFESFLHYEFPTAALLMGAAALLHRALTTQRWGWWFGFFLTCALLTYVRLTFHLAWVAVAVTLALLYQARNWRVVASAALLPVLLVLALYVKNQVLFGFFGASSRSGFTMALVTIHRLPPRERQVLVEQRLIHPASAISVYAGADAFQNVMDIGAPRGIPVLDRLRRNDGEVNYNHLGLIKAARIQLRDGRSYMQRHPGDYLRTVGKGLVDYMKPSTRWHPHDPRGSPHQAHRAILEPWENAYNTILHRYPWSPFGLYLLIVPLLLFGTGVAVRSLWQRRLRGCEQEKLVVFLTFNALFVPTLSCLVTIGELERYRFIVEAFMWIVALWAGRWLLAHRRSRPS